MSTLQAINLKNAAYGSYYNIQLDAYGNSAFANSITVAGAGTVYGGLQVGNYFVPPNAFYLKNRLINGTFLVSQRAVTGTNNITVGTAGPTQTTGYTTVDRWFTLAQTTSTAPSSAQTTGATGSKQLTISGAAGVTNVYVGQRIISANSYDLAGQTVTLSFATSNSLLSTVNYQLSYATTYNDTFGTIAAPTKTTITPNSPYTGSVSVTGTLTTYAVTFTIPAGVTTGLEVLFYVGAQISGTWILQDVQLEVGSAQTPIERRPFPQELALCQSYYEKSFPSFQPPVQFGGRAGSFTFTNSSGASISNPSGSIQFAVSKRLYPVSFVATTNAGTTLTVASVNYGTLLPGTVILTGLPVAPASITTGTGGAGTYTLQRTQTVVTGVTMTGYSGPNIVTYNPDALNAHVRDISAAVDCSGTIIQASSETCFSLYTVGNASTVQGDTLAVNWTAEVEVP